MSATNGSGRAGARRATNRLSTCTQAEACELLSSALAYMQAAGFEIRAGQRERAPGELVIILPNVQMETGPDGATFRPATAPAGEGRADEH